MSWSARSEAACLAPALSVLSTLAHTGLTRKLLSACHHRLATGAASGLWSTRPAPVCHSWTSLGAFVTSLLIPRRA
eukprot:1791023-Pyramimonas_sp.AAC.1